MRISVFSKTVARRFVLFALWLIPSVGATHARLVLPEPRDMNSGNKTGPCGAVAKPSAHKHEFRPGQIVNIEITETIDHPGRYFINFSANGQSDFTQYRLLEIPDIQGAPLPHKYTTTVTLPNITCENCTLQMIQSMEENPAAPSYYYSCADIKLTAASDSGGGDDGDNGSQDLGSNSPQAMEKAGFGCGIVTSNLINSGGQGSSGPSGSLLAAILLLLSLPFFMTLGMRQKVYVRSKRRNSR